ncbi:divergent polysaccharide deacetylase [Campylobacter pinnipediorum subsp. pinnipediorum]|uniref:divergent polysaccharide deacetylase family protein n=1 Tax=Campylobacter pinnipediorum TaxID=1965231 RepID=UPI000995743D|nr:divergent polysaccharide deacetylase family protein [Campylobacter pinnipediorum]AQW81835.1 divergent polysaccharide deacetylase [Campylobacter pinnipediorum subsp. pinnipediorum]
MAKLKKTDNKPKRRPRAKKAKKGRFFLWLFVVLAIISASSYLFFKNYDFDIKKKQEHIQKTEINHKKNIDKKTQKENSAKKSNKEAKPKTKKIVKFDKDENLSKLFLDTNTKDETYFLRQIKEDKKQKLETKQESTNVNHSVFPDKNRTEILQEKKIQTNDTKKIIEQNEKIIDKKIKIENNKTVDKSIAFKKTENKAIKNTKIKKPKLAIVIDDVANRHHVDMIRSVGLKMTPSFFPKTKHHLGTPKLAKEFEFYMIHLPMQAQHFSSPEINTLNVQDSEKIIDKKIKDVRVDFPTAKFMNNHTGSKFTSDFNAMDKAFKAFIKYDFIFIDSKTIATTKVKKVAKKYKKPYISRDVFLDDKDNKASINKEIKNAINIAKQKGYAIAIGHPRKNTIEALKQNRSYILDNVELVYVKDLYGFYR